MPTTVAATLITGLGLLEGPDPLTRVSIVGLECSAGLEKVIQEHAVSGTSVAPSFWIWPSTWHMNINNGINIGVDADGEYLEYVVHVCDDGNRPRWYSTDDRPYKVIDKWGRVMTWKPNGIRGPEAGTGEGHSYFTEPTWISSGVGLDNVDHGYADGGKYKPAGGEYFIGFTDEVGTHWNEDPRGVIGGDFARLDPDAPTWEPGPRRKTYTGECYIDQAFGHAHRDANLGHVLVRIEGESLNQLQAGHRPYRNKIQNIIVTRTNVNTGNYKANFNNTYPMANESQKCISLDMSEECAVVDCELRFCYGDAILMDAKLPLLWRSYAHDCGRDICLPRHFEDVLILENVLESCHGQLVDNEPAGQKLEPFSGSSDAMSDGLYIEDNIFGGGLPAWGQQGIFFSIGQGNLRHVTVRRNSSTQENVDDGWIKRIGSIFSGPINMGPEDGSDWLNPISRGQIVVEDNENDDPSGNADLPGHTGGTSQVFWMNVGHYRDLLVRRNSAWARTAGVRLSERCIAYLISGNTFFRDRGAEYGEALAQRSTIFTPDINGQGFTLPGVPGHPDAKWAAGMVVPDHFWILNDDLVPRDEIAPKAPTGAAAVTGQGRATVSWNAVTQNVDNSSCTDLDFYEIGREGAFGVGRVEQDTTSFTWLNLAPGSSQRFRVRAVDTSGNKGAWSSYSNSVTIQAIVVEPDVPTGLQVLTGEFSGRADATWDDEATATDWQIEVSDDQVIWFDRRTVTDPESSFTGLTDDTDYFFRLRARNSAGASEWTDPVKARVFDPFPGPPGIVTALAALVGQASGRIVYSWLDPSTPDLDHIVLQVKPATASWFGLILNTTIAAGVQLYTYNGLTDGLAYNARFRTVDADSNVSAWNTVTATPRASTPGTGTAIHRPSARGNGRTSGRNSA